MKPQLLSIAVIVALLLTSCSSKQNSLDEYNLKGSISKVYQNTFSAIERFGKWEVGDKKYYGNSSMSFNSDGYLTEYISYNLRNEIQEKQVYAYSDNILSEITRYDDDGKVKSKRKYIRNDENRISKVEHYESDGKISLLSELEYASGDKVSGGRYINTKGRITSSWKNEWKGNFINLQLEYDSLKKLKSKTQYERNGNGDVIEQKTMAPDGSVMSSYKIEYEYDDAGNWTKQIIYDGKTVDSFVIRRIIYSDANGNKLITNELAGIWKEVGDNDWIEFKKDGTYDKGYNENIQDFGKWELNEEQKTLTFKSEDPSKSKKYSFSYEDHKLILSTLEGKERIEFEKR